MSDIKGGGGGSGGFSSVPYNWTPTIHLGTVTIACGENGSCRVADDHPASREQRHNIDDDSVEAVDRYARPHRLHQPLLADKAASRPSLNNQEIKISRNRNTSRRCHIDFQDPYPSLQIQLSMGNQVRCLRRGPLSYNMMLAESSDAGEEGKGAMVHSCPYFPLRSSMRALGFPTLSRFH